MPTAAPVTIGMLHPGEMGAAVAAQARRKGARVLWCPAGRSQATHERARKAGLTPVNDLAELLGVAEVVFAICPPAAAQQVATRVIEHGYAGIYVEANATSPQRCARIAERLVAAGARVLDAALFGPPPVDGVSKAGLYLAGEWADIETVGYAFTGTAVEPVALDGGIGVASALKMAYSGYQKGTRVLAAVAHALAAQHGVTEHLVTEAAQTTGSPLAQPDELTTVAAKAWRWAPELHEVADTLQAEELPADLALSLANILLRWHDDKEDPNLSLEKVLAQLVNTT
jgi:3-hydroxyisobutyrate dehydrogenase-like beta-hydroxyacid dehydrogenase